MYSTASEPAPSLNPRYQPGPTVLSLEKFCAGPRSWAPVTDDQCICGSEVQNPPANAGDTSPIPGSGRSPGGGNGKPSPVFLLGESHGQRPAGYSSQCHKEPDMTEHTHVTLREQGQSPRLPHYSCCALSGSFLQWAEIPGFSFFLPLLNKKEKEYSGRWVQDMNPSI